MSHECDTCGQVCYCDGEDTFFDYPPDDCLHCPFGENDEGDDFDDEEWCVDSGAHPESGK